MKKLLVLCLTAALLLACLSGCDIFEKDTGYDPSLKCERYTNCAVFTFDDFPIEETASFELERTGLGEGAIYYQVNLKAGSLSISYKDTGLIHEKQPLGEFASDDEMPINSSGGYIEGDKITITFESFSPVSGEIIIAFTEDALKAINKDIQLHEHTREMHSNEDAHWYEYTCGCETPENSAKHSDIDENYICDGCDYVLPGHEHSYEYSHDDIGHGWSYTCGCKTPPNFAQHFDGDGDGRCDESYCEYHMVSYSISYDGKSTLEFLMDGYAPTEAKPGNTVILRAYTIMDADLVLYANGVKLENTHSGSDFWEYIFTMPDEDVVITHDIVGGFGPKECIDHIDENEDGFCDDCGYAPLIDSPDVAEILLDYEQSLRDEIDKLHAEHPEYNYYYHSVDEVHCILILNSDASADAIVAKYDMNNLFACADVSALNAIKMVSIIFERNEFTEDMHQKVKQISDNEALVENLFIDMPRDWYQSYMPKIEYYTSDTKVLDYTPTTKIISVFGGKDIILKSKDEYDAYLDVLLETAEHDYEKERISAARDLYDEAFFEENALIITRMITRSSCSIKLTVNNLYVTDNKVYVVIRTDEPEWGDCAMQHAFFGFVVDKSDVANVDEVITLE